MKLASFEAIIAALNSAGVRYLVASGMAVNAHGYLRYTQDVDLVIRLEPGNVAAAFKAIGILGYRPLVPITAQQFADPSQRERWIREKGMQVLNFFSDSHRETPVDVFVAEPFAFESEYEAALKERLSPAVEVRFVSITALIAMKKLANRSRDLDDIQHLRWIMEDSKDDGRDP